MGSSAGSVSSVQPESSMSFWSRFTGVFYSPAATFADIARKPTFIAPLIAVVIAALAATEVMLLKVGMERIMRLSIEQSRRGAQMTADQVQQAVEQGAKFASIFAHVAGLLGEPIVLLVVAGLGLAIVNGILGGQLNFKTTFSVVCYADLISILPALMGIVMILFGNLEDFNPQTPIPSSVGFFVNPVETSAPLYALAKSVDVFTFWFLALIGIGFSEATQRKAKTLSIFLVFLGLWVVWTLIKMGLAMLGG